MRTTRSTKRKEQQMEKLCPRHRFDCVLAENPSPDRIRGKYLSGDLEWSCIDLWSSQVIYKRKILFIFLIERFGHRLFDNNTNGLRSTVTRSVTKALKMRNIDLLAENVRPRKICQRRKTEVPLKSKQKPKPSHLHHLIQDLPASSSVQPSKTGSNLAPTANSQKNELNVAREHQTIEVEKGDVVVSTHLLCVIQWN